MDKTLVNETTNMTDIRFIGRRDTDTGRFRKLIFCLLYKGKKIDKPDTL